ncbi:MAG: SH3 domain-containing protein [Cocleimonas sp.]|nr:SH3 domain-containing protein [Cocleimonas sp.]
MIKYLSVVLLLTSVSVTFAPSIALAECSIVNTRSGTLNIRKSPSKKSKAIFKAHKGSAVSVEKYYKYWVKVKLNNGRIGYASKKYLTGGDCQMVVTDSGRLNIHHRSQSQSKIVGKASRYSAVRVLEYGHKWDKIKLNNGRIGYVDNAFLY